jgi:hypothetical protein
MDCDEKMAAIFGSSKNSVWYLLGNFNVDVAVRYDFIC